MQVTTSWNTVTVVGNIHSIEDRDTVLEALASVVPKHLKLKGCIALYSDIVIMLLHHRTLVTTDNPRLYKLLSLLGVRAYLVK